MLNIAIDDKDALYRNGMQMFLEEVFLEEQNEPVHFNYLTKKNAIQADVIVKSFVAGAEYICQPMLKYRSKPGLIIGIYSGDKSPYHDGLPLCIKNIVFINRSEPLSTAREQVVQAWKDNIENPEVLPCKKCLKCKYRSLTPQQMMIAKYLLQGNDIIDIAELLEINVKTVSAHKRLMMSKFNLSSDCELLHFLSNLKKHNPPVHLFP
ncbi:DNA-binding CsgD family transcriptional regulator [Buttiauxella sp. BIGb0471]|uniref:LuxR C-terminal-related transcriptional regulator n=1 Tax=Buttiauxella sp. BIGb0471 TaxID=2940597 RepID=UPI002166DF65|nr:LuxR C-terminal-related transcriptional regulator [Buttiauxella sp. BIGb0471]MCS3601735.1 DNA-binding CsgD family transcriptional regulator [Buttiauxella sp. BIGb0471]